MNGFGATCLATFRLLELLLSRVFGMKSKSKNKGERTRVSALHGILKRSGSVGAGRALLWARHVSGSQNYPHRLTLARI